MDWFPCAHPCQKTKWHCYVHFAPAHSAQLISLLEITVLRSGATTGNHKHPLGIT